MRGRVPRCDAFIVMALGINDQSSFMKKVFRRISTASYLN